MIEGIIIGALLMTAFLFGLKIGITINKKGDIVLNPIKASIDIVQNTKQAINEVREQTEAEKRTKLFEEGLNNIMNYEGPKV